MPSELIKGQNHILERTNIVSEPCSKVNYHLKRTPNNSEP